MPKCSEVFRLLKENGWYVSRQGKGSHVILKHSTIKQSISFPNHGSSEIATGTLKAIKKIAGLK